jgi:hypothetical protein
LEIAGPAEDHGELISTVRYGNMILSIFFSIQLHSPKLPSIPIDRPDITTESCAGADELQALETKSQRKIYNMEMAEINGPDAHPVLNCLKELFDIEEMDRKF